MDWYIVTSPKYLTILSCSILTSLLVSSLVPSSLNWWIFTELFIISNGSFLIILSLGIHVVLALEETCQYSHLWLHCQWYHSLLGKSRQWSGLRTHPSPLDSVHLEVDHFLLCQWVECFSLILWKIWRYFLGKRIYSSKYRLN